LVKANQSKHNAQGLAMTIHFAVAQSPLARRLVRPAAKPIIGFAANDNAVAGHRVDLRAALKHFAEHGLGAANVARRNAESAFFRGDRSAYRHWLGICRTLDRRMAGALAAKIAPGND
jgi:hypothetical protein